MGCLRHVEGKCREVRTEPPEQPKRDMTITLNSPCMIHEGKPNGSGYGQVQWRDEDGRKRHVGAHRKAYEDFYGVKIDPNREIHHVCVNRMCVNPHHLIQVTRREHRLIHTELRAA